MSLNPGTRRSCPPSAQVSSSATLHTLTRGSDNPIDFYADKALVRDLHRVEVPPADSRAGRERDRALARAQATARLGLGWRPLPRDDLRRIGERVHLVVMLPARREAR